MYVNKKQSEMIADLNKLRRSAWAISQEIGLFFARESAQEWKLNGFDGIRSAAWSLKMELLDLLGTADKDDVDRIKTVLILAMKTAEAKQ